MNKTISIDADLFTMLEGLHKPSKTSWNDVIAKLLEYETLMILKLH